MSEVGDRLIALLLELLSMPCVTGDEDLIATWLADRYMGRSEAVRRTGNSVVVGEHTDDRPIVLLIGHLDVVPPTAIDVPARLDGDAIAGRGASDMKSGLAVAMDLFEDPALRNGPVGLRLVAYAGEEGPHEGNELAGVLDGLPELADAALGIVLEPTDNEVQLGCMGGLHAHVAVRGAAAHSARPWQGRNALTAAAPLLAALDHHEPVDREVDGLAFRDVVTATQGWTSNAHNVVPDRFTVNVNYRFAPDRTMEQAETELIAMLGAMAGSDIAIEIVDRAPPAPPLRTNPYVQGMIAAAGGSATAKQAWTDVARLAAVGVPALNYGPGLTGQAHQAGEYVPAQNLEQSRAVLTAFLEDLEDRNQPPRTSGLKEVAHDGAERPQHT